MAYDPRLGEEWGFSAEDLAQNTAGRLTAEQIEGFRRTVAMNRRYSRRGGIMVTVFLGAGAALVAYALATQPGGTDRLAILVPVVMFAWMLLLLWFVSRRGRRMNRMFQEHRLRGAEGVLRTSPGMGDDGTSWIARFGDVRFEIDAIRHGLLEDGRRYRVNYLESGRERLLLTLEPLDP